MKLIMLSNILYLWQNRERPVGYSRRIRVWGKRLFHFVGICRLLIRPVFFRWRGASIGYLTVLGGSKVGGRFFNLSIGNETSLGRCEIMLHDRVTIGDRVVINDGVVLLTASHSLADPDWRQTKGSILIEDYAWLATNAMILPGVTIGRGAVIGAGAVVRENVPAYAVMIGNPAVQLPRQRTQEFSYSPVMLNAPFEAWVGQDFNKLSLGKVA